MGSSAKERAGIPSLRQLTRQGETLGTSLARRLRGCGRKERAMPVVERERYVEVAEVSKIYRNGTAEAIEAVSSVSFALPRGQFVAVLGPSGCGKSTLLMMLGGLEPVTSGQITIGHEPMTGPRTSIGIMFQDPTLLPWKSALDNVLFPIRVLKRPLEAYHSDAQQLLARVGL